MSVPNLNVLLHIGGGGSYGALVIVALIFLGLFALSFVLGRPPSGQPRLSLVWAKTWVRASLPRLAGAVAVLLVVFLGSWQFASSGNSGVCDQPLSPITTQGITAARISRGLEELEALARGSDSGSLNAAAAFLNGDSHTLTHDIDKPLRLENPGLARELCQSVHGLEAELISSPVPTSVADKARNLAGLLSKAGREMNVTG